jgi:cell division protein FtsW
MPKTLKHDHSLFAVTLALALTGVVMVFSSSVAYARERFGDANYFSFKQLLAAALGLAIMFVIMKVDYHVYQQPAVVFSALAVVVGLCTVVLFLPAVRNTYRWIQLPGLSLQPSELAKLGIVVFMAYFLTKRSGQINDVRFTLIPIGVIVGLLAGLVVMQKDLGTALGLALTAAIMLFVAGLNLKWIGLSLLLALPVGYVAFYLLVFLVPYRWHRILVFLDPTLDPQGYGHQPLQSLAAVGSGGIAGLGYMEGIQKLFYLPDAHTDFIFAVIGEEFGLIGTCAVLLMFSVFLWRGLRASLHAPDSFGFYLALGITITVCVQAFVNMSVVLSMVPNKGLPLPFLSYGGSSLVVMLASAGILLNVSQRAR